MANNVTDLGKVGMTLKGEYNSATTYERLDVVTYQGSSYVLIVESATNQVPTNTSYWQGIASKGDQGIQGIQGIQGEKGETGDRGPQGEQGIQGPQGPQGIKGDTGNDGVSPTVSMSKTGTVTTLIITDGTGQHTSEIDDGHTPVKGTDYFTTTEINEFTDTITTNVNNNLGIVIDGINGEVI